MGLGLGGPTKLKIYIADIVGRLRGVRDVTISTTQSERSEILRAGGGKLSASVKKIARLNQTGRFSGCVPRLGPKRSCATAVFKDLFRQPASRWGVHSRG